VEKEQNNIKLINNVLTHEIREMASDLFQSTFIRVKKEANKLAHRLASVDCDLDTDHVWCGGIPPGL